MRGVALWRATVISKTNSFANFLEYLWEVQRFDYTDFSSQLAGSFAAMRSNTYARDPGIADADIDSFWFRSGNNDSKALTNLQSQAMGYKYGLLGAGLVMLEALVRNGLVTINGAAQGATPFEATRDLAINDLNLFDNNAQNQGLLLEIMADMFLRNLPAQTPEYLASVTRFENTVGGGNAGPDMWRNINTGPSANDNDRYAKMRTNLMEILCSGISGSWYSKTSKIIGKAMNTAKKSGQLHIVLGHFKL